MIGHWSVSLAKYRSLIGVKLKQNRLRRTPTLSLNETPNEHIRTARKLHIAAYGNSPNFDNVPVHQL